MKNPHIVYPIAIAAVVGIAFFFVSGRQQQAEASKPLPPEAQFYVEQIQKNSERYATIDAEAKPLREKLAGFESEQTKLAQGNAGLDHTLCVQYGLKYTRGAAGKEGHVDDVGPGDCAPLD